MGSIKSSTMLTVDGVAGAPETWQFQYFSPEVGEIIGRGLADSSALLLGRVTYAEFAEYWPSEQARDNPYSPAMNGLPKYVVSTSLEHADWANTTIINGDVRARLHELRETTPGDLNIVGSPTLVRSLLDAGLLDEMSILLFPLVVGTGRRLFEEATDRTGLELTDFRQLPLGVLQLTYRPVAVERQEASA